MPVELVGEGVRGGELEELSTASAPVRGTRIVHKSTGLLWLLGEAQAEGEALAKGIETRRAETACWLGRAAMKARWRLRHSPTLPW